MCQKHFPTLMHLLVVTLIYIYGQASPSLQTSPSSLATEIKYVQFVHIAIRYKNDRFSKAAAFAGLLRRSEAHL
jgi:hypothetical protein